MSAAWGSHTEFPDFYDTYIVGTVFLLSVSGLCGKMMMFLCQSSIDQILCDKCNFVHDRYRYSIYWLYKLSCLYWYYGSTVLFELEVNTVYIIMYWCSFSSVRPDDGIAMKFSFHDNYYLEGSLIHNDFSSYHLQIRIIMSGMLDG